MEPTWASECGTVKLWCADCLEVLPVIEQVDAVVTDPPYGIYLKGGKWGKKASLQWDREPANGSDINAIIAVGREAIVWGGNYFALPPSRGWLVWRKLGAVASVAEVELCWTSLDMNARFIAMPKIGCVPNIHEGEHPTQKPVGLMKWCIEFVPEASTIIDPFMGSGTTGVAAVRLGRKFLGIEKEPKYFEIAKRRIQEALNSQPLFKEETKEHQSSLWE